jgi:predicted O-methyltransferase YrrM
VVEVGTLAGYSAIQLARALPAGGKLYSLELLPEHAAVARDNLAFAGLSERVEVRVGDARELLGALAREAPFDAVFLDADKGGYAEYGRWAASNLRPSGLLLVDNAYLFGRLLDDDDTARAVRAMHEQVARDFQSVCIPTPDGLIMGLKR